MSRCGKGLEATKQQSKMSETAGIFQVHEDTSVHIG
jgi:hypothetical protein